MRGYKRFTSNTKTMVWSLLVCRAISLGVKSRERPPESRICKLNYGVTFPLLEKQDVNEKIAQLCTPLIDSEKGGGRRVM